MRITMAKPELGNQWRKTWKLGKSVWFPRVEGSEMNFYLAEQKEDLQPGAYGILEPTGEYKADGYDGLLIMPGVAFDEECHRIGYGGGFYDKYLEKHSDLHTIALLLNCRCTENCLLRNMI